MLVVEDEALVAMELADVLQQQSCRVVGSVGSVDRALTLLETQQPDAALLDFNLRGKSALPVALALNERGVPFLVISGYSKAQSGNQKLGEVRWLTKPVSHAELVQALKQMFASTHQPDRVENST